MFILLLLFISLVNSTPVKREVNSVQEVQAPKFEAFKYRYERKNETDIMLPEPLPLQIIPMDFLCEFCQAVIEKLKERQKSESDFEQKLKTDCDGANTTDASLCDLISRVNLDRLKAETSFKICTGEKLCNNEGTNQKIVITGTQTLNPPHNVGKVAGRTESAKPEGGGSEPTRKVRVVANRNVDTEIKVVDI